MYLCLCNGFTDKQTRHAVEGGCDSVSKVYRHFGCRPQCGKCVPEIRDMVKTGHSTATVGTRAGAGGGD